MKDSWVLVVASAALAGTVSAGTEEFEEAIRLQAGGEFIDVEIGHAAPFVDDFDGDGLKDLLVGQFGSGQLWIFPNTGTNEKPVLGAGKLFKDGKSDGTVPTG